MGIIDSAIVTLTCPKCGLTESSRIFDKGSTFGGSHWGRPSFEKFDARVTGGAKIEPDVTAMCHDCGLPAHIGTQYGG